MADGLGVQLIPRSGRMARHTKGDDSRDSHGTLTVAVMAALALCGGGWWWGWVDCTVVAFAVAMGAAARVASGHVHHDCDAELLPTSVVAKAGRGGHHRGEEGRAGPVVRKDTLVDGTEVDHQDWIEDIFVNAQGVHLTRKRLKPRRKVRTKGVVVYCHGLGSHCHTLSKHRVAKPLCEAGIEFWTFDQMGFGKSVIGCTPGIMPNAGRDCENDVVQMAEAAAAAHPGLPLCLMGDSMGGALSILASLRLQDTMPQFKGAVLIAPAVQETVSPKGLKRFLLEKILIKACPRSTFFTPPISREKTFKMEEDRQRAARDPLCRFPNGLPLLGAVQAVYLLERMRPMLETIHFPFCIFHGTEDHVVPIDGSHELMAMAATPPELKEFVEVEGGWHDLLSDPQTPMVVEQIVERVTAMFAKK